MIRRYYVNIVPQSGDTAVGFLLRRRHVAMIVAALALVLGCTVTGALMTLRARAEVTSAVQQSEIQHQTIASIGAKTDALRAALAHVQRQNREIAALVGVPALRNAAPKRARKPLPHKSLAQVEADIRSLDVATTATVQQSDGIRSLALRVLNVRHLRDVARATELAAIPSIDPVSGALVVGCFCYRTSPDVEFHEGVDLGADYGETVRAAAAGTVVANGYDGAFGIKVDIDHGNGYHTWYAHLSHADVTIGEHVRKGQTIAAVGATGFATGPHLHYQVMYDGTPVDPAPFLNGIPANVLASLP